MVKIPTPETQGASPIGNVQMADATTPYQSVQASGWGRQGAQLQEFGNALGSLGTAIAQQQQDIALLEAQKQIADFETAAFDPNTGIFTRHGANAMGASQEMEETLSKLTAGILGNSKLSGASRRAVERYLLGQQQRLVGKAATHEYGEGQNYQKSLLAADVEASIDRFVREINDPEARDANLLRIESSVRSSGAFSGSPEIAIRGEIEAQQSAAIASSVQDLSRYSPVKAMELLDAYRDNVDPQVYVELAGQLEPKIKEWNGQIQGRTAYYISQTQNRGLYGRFSVGLSQAMAEAEATFGPGAVTITSGYRTPQEQANIIYGNWHKFDLNPQDRERWMADVNTMGAVAAGQKWAPVFDAATRTTNDDDYGTPFRAWIGLPGMSSHQRRGAADLGYASDEVRQWMHNNAERFGLTFRLGNEPWHVEPIGGPEFGPEGGTPEQLAAATAAARDASAPGVNPDGAQTDPTQLILGIADPIERQAAMTTYTAMTSFQTQATQQRISQLTSTLVGDINNAHAGGAPIDPMDLTARLTAEERALLGDKYDAILEYGRKMATGEYVVTTPEGQRKIVGYIAQATSTDPAQRQAFLAMDFETADINDISPDDRVALIERQASMRSAQSEAIEQAQRFPVGQSEISGALGNLITDQLIRADIDPSSDEGKAYAALVEAQVTTQLERQFRADPGGFRYDPLTIRDTARALLEQRISRFNPPGIMNEAENATYGELIGDLATSSPEELSRSSMTIPVRKPDGTMAELEIPKRMMRSLVDVYTGKGISAPDDIVMAILQADYAFLAEMARRYGGEIVDQGAP